MSKHAIKIADDVKNAILNAEWHEDALAFGPPGSMDQDLYKRVMVVTKNAGLKWNRGRGCHVGTVDAIKKLRQAVEGEIVLENEIKKYQLYPTVPAVADRMVAALFADRPNIGAVLEPSAGMGNLVEALLRVDPALGRIKSLRVVEINPDHARCLRQLPIDSVTTADFLVEAETQGPGWMFDSIIANPPFADGRDRKHLLAMLTRLKPGGRLVCLVCCTSGAKLLGPFAANPAIKDFHISEPIVAGDTTGAKSVMVTVNLK